jgi:hypothetical protein
MYSKEESKKIRLQFWNRFKAWSGRKRNKLGMKGKWLLNDTGIKQLKLKLHFDENKAQAGIEIDTRNLDKRIEIWEKMESLKVLLMRKVSFPLTWEFDYPLENGKTVSRVYDQLNEVNIYDPACWKKVNEFLFSRMIIFEAFFLEYKDFLKSGAPL